MSKQSDSIVKGTKDGVLYILVSELFQKSDVQDIITKLEKSSIKKEIDKYKQKEFAQK